MATKLYARTVLDCWLIAREHARAYQRSANNAKHNPLQRAACILKRDAADRIALTIRYGSSRKPHRRR